MNNDDVRVYGKHLQSPSVIHQACIVDWTIHEQRQREEGELQEPVQVDLVFGKGSYLSLYRFRADEAGHELRPAGLLSLVHEQPVFGTIKDVKALRCTFESDDEDDSTMGMDIDRGCDCPRLGYLPKGASSNVLMATSDSGLLSFVTFHFHRGGTNAVKCGQFYILKEIEIAEPGFDYSQTGASIAIDPTSRIVAISALQNHIKLVLLKNTRRSHFDPVEKILKVDLKGTILGMDFLTTDSVDTAILAVLFYNKETSRYHIATFHIGLQSRATGSIPIRVGTSQLRLSSSKSVILLKALPNISCSLVCVDEEKITLITVDAPTHSGAFNAVKHTYHGSLHLLKREILGGTGASPSAPTDEAYALISACATPPRSPYARSDQTLYLGSDTSELYRVNIQYLTYTMQFELVSGDRPVGNVMQVLARRQFTTEPLFSDVGQSIVLNTDYLIYSNDYGDGGVLAVREEEDGIDLFAVTELENCSPVLDFCAREPSFPGRDSLYVCSGMRNEGSLQRIRAGISVESSGSSGNQFFAGATGLWSAKESDEDAFDSYLLVSFIQSTKLMRSGEEGALEDVSESSGLSLDQATVQAGRLRNHMIFQVHRSGVVAIDLTTGTRFVWNSDEGVVASACLIKDGFLALGQITSGSSRLIVLEQEQGSTAGSFKIVVSMPLRAEPTAIHCWTEDPQLVGLTIDTGESGVFCCVGTLEPAILVFYINANSIREVYKESMAQAGLESVTIPHAICLLREPQGQSKVVVGLRDGNIIAYDWTDSSSPQQQSELGGRCLSSPRLFKLGILPVKLAFADSHSSSGALMLSDKLWQARFDGTFEIQPVLFDSEVSQVCSFQSGDEEHSSKPGYVFIVDHHDIQLVTLEGSSKYSHQTLALGRTPRRILDITSKKLLLVASVGDGFPFAESTLQLVDPDRFSHDAGIEKQHIVAEFSLRQGEAVFALAEWKIPRPNKSDAVYICVGTGLFSPTGSEVSAAAPKTGRLVVLSVKQSKKTDRRLRKFELDLRWAMAMPAPVFAISTFLDMRILISNGPVMKLLALDLERKTLVEKASYRERWPIVQISSCGSTICTGSRRESMCFYEHQAGSGFERDKLRFLRSAPTQRMISDCFAISPEFAVGVDMSGGIFGLGYFPEDPSCQHTLLERFSFHVGEVVNRIRLAKVWPADVRSLTGVPLSQRTREDMDGSTTASTTTTAARVDDVFQRLRPSMGQMSSWILVPWTSPENQVTSTQLTQSTSPGRLSSQALIACSLIGSILGFWRLNPQIYQILSALQSVLQTSYECRPLLGNIHDRFRSLSSPGLNTVDGNLINRFLRLDHALQVEVAGKAVGLVRIVDDWLQQIGIDEQRRVYLESLPKSSIGGEVTEGRCAVHRAPEREEEKEEKLCRATNVIWHVASYLQDLDWHQ